MEFITIPGTALRASRIALGTWSIGGSEWGGSDETESIRAIHAALDLGVNLFDTAPSTAMASPKKCWAAPSPVNTATKR